MACAGLAKIGDGRVDVGLPLSESCFLAIATDAEEGVGTRFALVGGLAAQQNDGTLGSGRIEG